MDVSIQSKRKILNSFKNKDDVSKTEKLLMAYFQEKIKSIEKEMTNIQ